MPTWPEKWLQIWPQNAGNDSFLYPENDIIIANKRSTAVEYMRNELTLWQAKPSKSFLMFIIKPRSKNFGSWS